jgi:ABC-type transport system involved in multi-copper enzyme maturation permease subunit
MPWNLVDHVFDFRAFSQLRASEMVFWLVSWALEIAVACSMAAWVIRSESRTNRFTPRLGFATELPLLRRELIELSNRRRTYVVRIIGACFLLLFVFMNYHQAITERLATIYRLNGFRGPTAFLGIGGTVFSRIAPALFGFIELLLPALCCSAITAEKENNTIGTLLLTRLSPGAIILEKVGSRIVPMLTILLLAFPVLAYVHSLGGVDTDLLIGTIWLLLTECFLVAGIAILCSAWFASTTASFVASYAIIGGFLTIALINEGSSLLPSAIWYDVYVRGNNSIMAANRFAAARAGLPAAAGGFPNWLSALRLSLTPWFAIFMVLLVARLVVVRRAFVTPSSVLLKVFHVVDGFFRWLNDRTTGGIEIVKDSNPMPTDDPVAWRERTKKSLGKARYLFRILVGLEVPTLLICTIAATASARNAFQGLYILECLIWTLVTLIAAVKASTLFASERARETIEPLLATPMTAGELLQQKIAGVRRLQLVLCIPVLTVSLTYFLLNFDLRRPEALLSFLRVLSLTAAGVWSLWVLYRILNQPTSRHPRPARTWEMAMMVPGLAGLIYVLFIESSQAAFSMQYLLLSVCTATILLSLVTWTCTGVGMIVHSQTRAVLSSVGLLATWVILPIVFVEAMWISRGAREVALLTSPYSMIEATERFFTGSTLFGRGWTREDDIGEFWWIATHSVYGLLALGIRRQINKRAPRLLNRLEQPTAATMPPTVAASAEVVA